MPPCSACSGGRPPIARGGIVRQAIYRVLISCMLATYLTVSLASVHKETAWGRTIYREFRWVNTALCLWQNWGMFAPPPGSSSWLKYEGTTSDGKELELEPLFSPLPEGFFRWRYDRLQKLSLSSFQKSRRALRTGIGRYFCYREAKAGNPLKEVRLIRDRTWTLRPSKRRQAKPAPRRNKVTTIETVKCPRTS